VNAATDLTQDETESRRHDPMPEHQQDPRGTQHDARGDEREKADRLLNITA
jgi:hypothetical protein